MNFNCSSNNFCRARIPRLSYLHFSVPLCLCGELVFSSARNRGPRFGVGSFAALGFALVPELFAAVEGEFTFGFSMPEINTCRDERQPLLLGFANHLAQLFPVDKEFAGAQRLMIKDVAMIIRADVGVQQP